MSGKGWSHSGRRQWDWFRALLEVLSDQKYFASDAPSSCWTWKPRGDGSSCLCASWAGLLLNVCRNKVPCNSWQCFLFPTMFLKPIYSTLPFSLTAVWARGKTFCVWLEIWPSNQRGQRQFTTFPLAKTLIWISSLSRCSFLCNS